AYIVHSSHPYTVLEFCASYSEAVRLKVSTIMTPSLQTDSTAFHQFVYDNANFNARTLNGYDTFRAMGNIHLITPKCAPNLRIVRVKKTLPAQLVGEMGSVSLKHFEEASSPSLKNIKIEDLKKLFVSPDTIIPFLANLTWLYGKWKDVPGIPGWSGFMEQTTSGLPCHLSVHHRAIRYIMAGSSLKELLNAIYVLLSTERILTGHAYSRAARAHILGHATLAIIILESIDLTLDLQEKPTEILNNAGRSVILSAHEKECIEVLKVKFFGQLQALVNRDATSKLWVQYFEMVTLVKLFIETEKTANWNFHLQVVGLGENQRWSGTSNHTTAASTWSRFKTYFLQVQEELPEKLSMQGIKCSSSCNNMSLTETEEDEDNPEFPEVLEDNYA
ncbi:hypothetical protein ILUMI_16616, partial [Ignelater luminosus]